MFFSKRQKIHVPILRVWSTDDPHPQEEVSLSLSLFSYFFLSLSSYFFFFLKIVYFSSKLFIILQYLDCLWAQIKNLQSHKWMENQINRPYLAFDSVLSEALQHTLPQIIPPAHDEDAQYPLPSVVYRMFDYTDVPEVKIL